MKQHMITPRFVEFIPKVLEDGVLYIAKEYDTATHRCCCGCGAKIVMSLLPTDHRLIEEGPGTVSIWPSIGNWDHPCRSHYWIKQNRVFWAGPMTKAQIDYAFRLDEAQREAFFRGRLRDSTWWRRAWRKLAKTVSNIWRR